MARPKLPPWERMLKFLDLPVEDDLKAQIPTLRLSDHQSWPKELADPEWTFTGNVTKSGHFMGMRREINRIVSVRTFQRPAKGRFYVDGKSHYAHTWIYSQLSGEELDLSNTSLVPRTGKNYLNVNPLAYKVLPVPPRKLRTGKDAPKETFQDFLNSLRKPITFDELWDEYPTEVMKNHEIVSKHPMVLQD